jgi:hypothetical protein
MSEKPRVSETAIARQFVLHVLQTAVECWPHLSQDVLRDYFASPTVLDTEAAPYECAFALAAVQIQALPNLFPTEQAARIRSHVVGWLCSICQGQPSEETRPYPAGAIEEYQVAWDRSLQVAEEPWLGAAAVLFDKLVNEVASDPMTINPMLLFVLGGELSLRGGPFWKTALSRVHH